MGIENLDVNLCLKVDQLRARVIFIGQLCRIELLLETCAGFIDNKRCKLWVYCDRGQSDRLDADFASQKRGKPGSECA